MYVCIINKNSLAVKKVQGQLEARLQTTKTSDIKEDQQDKTLISFYRNDILLGIFTTMIYLVTQPPLQIMPDSPKGGQVTKSVVDICLGILPLYFPQVATKSR